MDCTIAMPIGQYPVFNGLGRNRMKNILIPPSAAGIAYYFCEGFLVNRTRFPPDLLAIFKGDHRGNSHYIPILRKTGSLLGIHHAEHHIGELLGYFFKFRRELPAVPAPGREKFRQDKFIIPQDFGKIILCQVDCSRNFSPLHLNDILLRD